MDLAAGIECLEKKISLLQDKLSKLTDTSYGIVSDIASRGRKGKRPLESAKNGGINMTGYAATKNRRKV